MAKVPNTLEDLEAQVRKIQKRNKSRFDGCVTSIATKNKVDDGVSDNGGPISAGTVTSWGETFTSPKRPKEPQRPKRPRIAEREDEYRGYAAIIREEQLHQEEQEVRRKMVSVPLNEEPKEPPRKRSARDQTGLEDASSVAAAISVPAIIKKMTALEAETPGVAGWDETREIILQEVKQCFATDDANLQYIKTELLPHFFKSFWNHRVALDQRNCRQLIDTTVEIANRVGTAEIIGRIFDDIKFGNEQYREMVVETAEKIMGNLGAADIDDRLEEQLIDGILYAFQEQTTPNVGILNGFETIVNVLSKRAKPYLPQICGTILWRLNNNSAKVRQQAADLISRIASVMKTCQEEKLAGHLGAVLYEYLDVEDPEVLGSILGALKAIVIVIGTHKMTPPIKDLLPRLGPILKNSHEKVQENCIDLVGRIADRGPEYVSTREWMSICLKLLDPLSAHKKAIRIATAKAFGYIAKAIGPQQVLAAMLNNLEVQVVIRLLYYVWPDIFETSPHFVQDFMDTMEEMRVALGPIQVLPYTLKNLFHPMRGVRDVYWKMFNSLYISGQDSLVAGYPRVHNDVKNTCYRYELDYVL